MNYLALCCIAKDEDPFLKEWIAYHSLLGVEHFYIYDNCSRIPIRQTLGSYVDDARVTIRRIQGKAMQIPAYNDCLESFGGRNLWIGFIDLDEFALPMRDNDLRVLLSEFEEYGGLAATWHLVGSSGHLKRPEGPVVKNYTQSFAVQESFHIKSFAQPAKTLHALNPHYCGYKPGHYCVNENHYPVSPRSQATFAAGNLVRVNHYFLRSQQDFEEKLVRGSATNASPDAQLDMTMFYEGSARTWADDTEIHRFLPPLLKAMQKKQLPPVFPRLPFDAPYEDLLETAMNFFDAGQLEKALAVTCRGVLAHGDSADLWTLRSMIALAAGSVGRADVFIRRSISLESTETGYTQLAKVLKAMGQDEQAGHVQTLMRRCPKYFT